MFAEALDLQLLDLMQCVTVGSLDNLHEQAGVSIKVASMCTVNCKIKHPYGCQILNIGVSLVIWEMH